jgi:DNA helicase II / ATP-dependent DNA helicase PcrA
MPSLILTAEQEKLVALKDGCHLVVAPPGSGKTEVLAQRTVRLLQDSPGDTFNVLALSFTKNAAGSMRQRVSERLGDVSGRVSCTTYHAFCLDVLQHYGHFVNVPRELTVYDRLEDRVQALRQGLVSEGVFADSAALPYTDAVELLDKISRQKRALVLPEAVPPEMEGASTVSLCDAYRAYDRVLQQNGAVDFDTVLVLTHRLLSDYPKVARHYRTIYRYILIDEAQDTSLAQYEILRALCAQDRSNVFMVADPAQSIYAFAGASSKFVDRFIEEFHASRHELTVTFRCAQAIVDVAKKLFVPGGRDNAGSLLTSHSIARGRVSYEVFATEAEEAGAVVDWAEDLVQHGLPSEALSPKEDREVRAEHIAILARSRIHLKATIAELEKRGCDYHFSAGDAGVFDSDHYRALLYGLKLLSNTRDVATAKTLVAAVQSINKSLELDEIVTGDRAGGDQLFTLLAERMRGSILEIPLEALARCARRQCDVTEGMETLLAWEPTTDQNDAGLADLLTGDREFLGQRWTTYKSTVDQRERTWHGLLLEIVSKPKPESPGFRVLTVHAAKGLEFRAVSVVALNEGSFPDFRNSGGDALNGERRLVYVAATRAARVLRFSRARLRSTRFGPRLQEESQFVALAGMAG